MTENRRVLRNTPVIVQDGEIGVTQAAVFDSHFNVLGPERSEINSFEHHRLFRRLGNPSLVIHCLFLFREQPLGCVGLQQVPERREVPYVSATCSS